MPADLINCRLCLIRKDTTSGQSLVRLEEVPYPWTRGIKHCLPDTPIHRQEQTAIYTVLLLCIIRRGITPSGAVFILYQGDIRQEHSRVSEINKETIFEMKLCVKIYEIRTYPGLYNR
jgi:hypothetical protein